MMIFSFSLYKFLIKMMEVHGIWGRREVFQLDFSSCASDSSCHFQMVSGSSPGLPRCGSQWAQSGAGGKQTAVLPVFGVWQVLPHPALGLNHSPFNVCGRKAWSRCPLTQSMRSGWSCPVMNTHDTGEPQQQMMREARTSHWVTVCRGGAISSQQSSLFYRQKRVRALNPLCSP